MTATCFDYDLKGHRQWWFPKKVLIMHGITVLIDEVVIDLFVHG
jgi:hypothetical protein